MKKSDRIEKRDEFVLREDENGKVTVRDFQLQVLKIMDEIHRVCEKNNIEYCLIAGSALGICNYKGFIPWDDDIDICIERKNWKKFIKALKKDLDSGFYFQCFEEDPTYFPFNPLMKIRKRGTYHNEINILIRNRCKSGDGIPIDVVTYDSVAGNRLIDELYSLPIRLLMIPAVICHNLGIKAKLLKRFCLWWDRRYSEKYKDSEYMSQTTMIPWEKPFKKPTFKKEDILPFKKYEFEGRQFYSYNNIETIMKQWYGPNCLKKWDGEQWVETLPVEKRYPKHTNAVNLDGDDIDKRIKNRGRNLVWGMSLSIILLIIALILFNDISFTFIGVSIIVFAITIYITMNK